MIRLMFLSSMAAKKLLPPAGLFNTAPKHYPQAKLLSRSYTIPCYNVRSLAHPPRNTTPPTIAIATTRAATHRAAASKAHNRLKTYGEYLGRLGTRNV